MPVEPPENGHFVLFWGLYCPPLIPARIWAIPGIPKESILAQGPAKLIIPFQRNVERNSNSARMVPGFTWMEWHLEWQEWNPRFGCHQAINLFFLNHHHHHWQRPSTTASSPPLPHRHHHVVVTITIGHHHPHPLPTTTTMQMMWCCHVTQWTRTGHNYTTESKVPHCWQWCGKWWMTTMSLFVIFILSESSLPSLTLLLTTEPGATSSLSTTWQPNDEQWPRSSFIIVIYLMGSTTTTQQPHSNTTTQPPPAWHDDDHHGEDAMQQQWWWWYTQNQWTWWCQWMTNTTMQMDNNNDRQQRWKMVNTMTSKNGEWWHLSLSFIQWARTLLPPLFFWHPF